MFESLRESIEENKIESKNGKKEKVKENKYRFEVNRLLSNAHPNSFLLFSRI